MTEGSARLSLPDEERIRLQTPVYDALYAFVGNRVKA